MLVINEKIRIPLDELQFSFACSGGPGGQNVNKVASKAVMRWNVTQTPSLPEEVRLRFLAQQKNRITVEGELVLMSQLTRDQERNREDCLHKLSEMILRAAIVPTVRKATKPSKSANRRRLGDKKRASAVKANRQVRSED